jgi:hypothetical protein
LTYNGDIAETDALEKWVVKWLFPLRTDEEL